VWLLTCAPEAVALHKAHYPSRADDYGPYFRQFLAMGAGATGEDAMKARTWRAEFSASFALVLESVDAMACPAGGAPAWPVTHAQQVGGFGELSEAMARALPRATEFTMPMNLAGTPAVCLPSGFSPQGLPYSIQFAGRRLSEPLLCRVAYAYEQATTWHNRHPAL
jgi:amidase